MSSKAAIPAFLTTEEVLSCLKVNPRTIYRLIKTGELTGGPDRAAMAVPALRPGRVDRPAADGSIVSRQDGKASMLPPPPRARRRVSGLGIVPHFRRARMVF